MSEPYTLSEEQRTKVDQAFGYVPEPEPLDNMIAVVEAIVSAALAEKEAELMRLWKVHEQYISDNVDLTEAIATLSRATVRPDVAEFGVRYQGLDEVDSWGVGGRWEAEQALREGDTLMARLAPDQPWTEISPAIGPALATADDVIEGRARYADTSGGRADQKTRLAENPGAAR